MNLQHFILLGLFIGCSTGSGTETTSAPGPIRFHEEVPDHILEVENLTVFPANPEPRYSIDLMPVQSFGDTGEPYLTNITTCVVDGNGRVIITDRESGNSRLHVYNPDGTYLTQIGRSGSGPGEFGLISNLQVKAGKIIVYDLSNRRLNLYDAENYSFEKTSLLQDWSVRDHEAVRNMRLLTFRSRNDGNHLALFDQDTDVSGRRLNNKYILVNTDGDVLNPNPLVLPSSYFISSSNQRRLTISLPFLGSSRFALSDEDEMYTAWNEDFLIKKYDAEGRYQSAFYYPALGPPLDLDAFDGWFGYSLRDIKNALETSNVTIPETYPILSGLRIDDENRIWVAVTVKFLETYEWWVLNESGEMLAKFRWPHEQRINDIKDGYLYSHHMNLESGENRIVKYRIDLTER